MLGQLFLFLALAHQRLWRVFWLVFSGVAFGASCATKWNGLWFLLGTYLLWIIAWGNKFLSSFYIRKVEREREISNEVLSKNHQNTLVERETQNNSFSLASTLLFFGKRKFKNKAVKRFDERLTPIKKLTQLNLFQILFFLGIIPAIIYSLLWIPHLQLDTRYGFIEIHKQILGFHERLGNKSNRFLI